MQGKGEKATRERRREQRQAVANRSIAGFSGRRKLAGSWVKVGCGLMASQP